MEPVEEDGEPRPLRRPARKFGGIMEGDYPPDLAKNHDHYLYGRSNKP